ncbi:hypothetical protein SAMN05216554_4088 [Herbiconiux ginsengi]|uniref:Uncharacterized protein n=1 Tax=Herbiconiux ginsengi TaxID=381665 RepID=A0A1H3TFG2_9MICO|nr:hypothetical protein SAMN05216554_4088 [Herbiconiux ginsengi]
MSLARLLVSLIFSIETTKGSTDLDDGARNTVPKQDEGDFLSKNHVELPGVHLLAPLFRIAVGLAFSCSLKVAR